MLVRDFLSAATLRRSGDFYGDAIWDTADTYATTSGVSVNRDTAMGVAAVNRAVNILAGSIGVLPLSIFKRQGKGKKPATDHPLYWPLKLRPNNLQTSYRWRHHLMGHVFFSGNYYGLKVPPMGSKRYQVWPLDSERTEITRQLPDGTLEYEYTRKSGQVDRYHSDQLVHIRGFSTDGLRGVSMIQAMAQTMGLSLATTKSRAAFMKNGVRPSMVLVHPGSFKNPKTRERMAVSFRRAFGGVEADGSVPVLEEGLEPKPFQMSARDAQWVEGASLTIEDFVRFTGVPGVLLGHADKTATYASAEQFFQSFATYTLYPYVRNIEQELMVSLLSEDEWEEYLIEMDLNALMRPESSARSEFYRAMIELGVLTRNEVRELENRNPLPGLDKPLTPKNMGTDAGEGEGDDPPAPPPKGAPKPPPDKEPDPDAVAEIAREIHERHERVALAAIRRLVRKEIAAITGGGKTKGAAVRYQRNPEAWRRWVVDFYARHSADLRETLQVSTEGAEGYCAAQRDGLIETGVSWLDQEAMVSLLAELAGVKGV